ncbi:MAG: alpha/beta hydrolase [Polyangiales bacterium]
MRIAACLALFMLVSAVGCASWLPAPEPMTAVDSEQPGPRARCLLVFLPGRGNNAQSFTQHGFVADVRQRQLSIDIVAADATLGYYTRGNFTERLSHDVVLRRIARGYSELWLVGPSMGGFGTLLYSRQRPHGEVTGVFALAPYLGSDSDVFDAIERDGGLAQWRAPARQEPNEDNYAAELWRWLQAVTRGREPGPQLYLGYGDHDRLAKTNALLSNAMPREHVFIGPGGHNWTTWRRLFGEFLDRGPLRERCRKQ